MFRTRLLACLSASVIGGIACQALLAGEPAAPPPPARSIQEWKSTSGSAPAAPPAPAKSIKEWKAAPSSTPGPCPAASQVATASAATDPSAGPAANAAAPTKPVTISLKSTLRRGSLVVMLDDVPIFNQKFEKPLLVLSQTTTWDPLKVTPGTHRLSAKVHGTKKTYFSKTYDLQLMSTKGVVLRFAVQGDKLTVELDS